LCGGPEITYFARRNGLLPLHDCSSTESGGNGQNVDGRGEMNAIRLSVLASSALLSLGLSGTVLAQQANMTFFVISVGPGKGGDLGSIAGADA
jgi:hypothetical protein